MSDLSNISDEEFRARCIALRQSMSDPTTAETPTMRRQVELRPLEELVARKLADRFWKRSDVLRGLTTPTRSEFIERAWPDFRDDAERVLVTIKGAGYVIAKLEGKVR